MKSPQKLALFLGLSLCASAAHANCPAGTRVDPTANFDQRQPPNTCSARGYQSDTQCRAAGGHHFKPNDGSGFTECFFRPLSAGINSAGPRATTNPSDIVRARAHWDAGDAYFRDKKYKLAATQFLLSSVIYENAGKQRDADVAGRAYKRSVCYDTATRLWDDEFMLSQTDECTGIFDLSPRIAELKRLKEEAARAPETLLRQQVDAARLEVRDGDKFFAAKRYQEAFEKYFWAWRLSGEHLDGEVQKKMRLALCHLEIEKAKTAADPKKALSQLRSITCQSFPNIIEEAIAGTGGEPSIQRPDAKQQADVKAGCSPPPLPKPYRPTPYKMCFDAANNNTNLRCSYSFTYNIGQKSNLPGGNVEPMQSEQRCSLQLGEDISFGQWTRVVSHGR